MRRRGSKRLLARLVTIVTMIASAALFGPPGASQEQVERGPYLQLGTPTGIVVRWRTDVATTGRVSFGPQPGLLTSTVDDPELAVEHEVQLSGLSPDTTYYYAVGTMTGTLAGDDPAHFFVTPPAPGARKPIRVWVLGDSGTGDANAAAVRAAYEAFSANRRADLWLMLGDNAHPAGTDTDHEVGLFDVYPGMLRSAVLWTSLGDRDALSADAATQSGAYFDAFTLAAQGEAGGVPSGTEAYYSFDYANVHFVALDSSGSNRAPGGSMVTWLEQDLAATTQEWIVAYWHHSPFSRGLHDSDLDVAMIEMRGNVVPVLEAHGVDLVLTAHSNDYERSFLIDGHYGDSTTFGEATVVDGGDGRELGTGAYTKPLLAPEPHRGTIYVVAGSAGQTAAGALDHPAMFESLAALGSVVVDIDGARLDVTFIDDTGGVRDQFALIKGVEDPDGDGIVTSQDNCPAVANPDQADFDGNGSGDLCADLDGDGVVDGLDCAPQVPGVSALPGPIGSTVRVEASSEIATIRWSTAPQGHASNVYRGVLPAAGNPIDTLTCFDIGNPGESSVDPEVPAADTAFFYVVSGVNACGSGSAGEDGESAPRSVPDCASVDGDADGDAIPDLADNCATVPNAGQSDVDGDFRGDECDNCPTLANPDQLDSDDDLRGDACGGLVDLDGDGIEDPADNCVDEFNTTQADADEDGAGDACDPCAGDPLKVDPGVCGCGVADTDTDADGTLDCDDPCAADPLKVDPGVCGCGAADTDTDADGLADCLDADDDNDGVADTLDASGFDPAVCQDVDLDGCDDCALGSDGFGPLADHDPDNDGADADSDGTCDLGDGCPGDPGKAAPGVCGCGVADTDTDADGAFDCNDLCPTDPSKVTPGECGCGAADADWDGDGVLDCNDDCPTAPDPDQTDSDADGIGDPCDSGGPWSGTVSLAWDPALDESVWGYRIYYGTAAGTYSAAVDAGPATALTVTGLPTCATSYFAVTARTVTGLESALVSNEVSGWPRPEIFSVVPPVVAPRDNLDLTVDGMNFQPGATVEFASSGIDVDSVAVTACGRMIVSVRVAPNADSGPVGFDVVNPDGVFRTATLYIE